MLKKAGIVVAATAAGLLAVSPLAFAGGNGGGHGHGHGHGGPRGGDDYFVTQIDDDRTQQSNSIDESSAQNGLINVGDVNALQQVCPSVPVAAGLNLPLLGLLNGPTTNTAAAGSASDVECTIDESRSQSNIDDIRGGR